MELAGIRELVLPEQVPLGPFPERRSPNRDIHSRRGRLRDVPYELMSGMVDRSSDSHT